VIGTPNPNWSEQIFQCELVYKFFTNVSQSLFDRHDFRSILEHNTFDVDLRIRISIKLFDSLELSFSPTVVTTPIEVKQIPVDVFSIV